MAQNQLLPHYCRLALMLGLLSITLATCVHAQDERSVGMTLLFMNKGANSIGVKRFDPDGQRGPTPGALGAGGGGAQMSFMPGDSTRGVPQFVEVEWLVTSTEVAAAQTKRNQTFEKYSPAWMDETERINSITPHYTRRIDLTPILTSELLQQVRANRSTTNLKLVVLFKDDDVTVIAEPEVWRSPTRKYSLSDSSPEALAEAKAASAAGAEQAQRAFYGMGYYVGRLSGALTGALSLSVRMDGTLSAVVNGSNGQIFTLAGSFDMQSTDAVRSLTLKGTGAQGFIVLSGRIDLKARKAQGSWSLSSSAQNTPNVAGAFMAVR